MAQLDFHPTFITALEGISQVHELIKLTWKQDVLQPPES
jgi:hypothetical protein